jgi:hypothetical protein
MPHPLTGCEIGEFEMKRIAGGGIGLTVPAILAISGQAAACTPGPIPMPRTGNVAVAHVARDEAHAPAGVEG